MSNDAKARETIERQAEEIARLKEQRAFCIERLEERARDARRDRWHPKMVTIGVDPEAAKGGES